MFRAAILLILLAATAAASTPSRFIGHWEGAISRFGSVQLLSVDLQQQGDSTVGTFSIPELSLYEEPVDSLDITDTILTLHINYGTFRMHVCADYDQLTGINTNWGPPVSLHLKKTAVIPALFYSRKEISFTSDSTRLKGSLYLPQGSGPFPAVVLVHGSGDQGRHAWHYRSHVFGLVRAGIAVFAYDKRGCGQSEGSSVMAPPDVLARDALAARRACADDPAIDKHTVGLFGISQGGWLLARAFELDPSISFLIFYCGPAVSVFQQDIDRLRGQMADESYGQPSIDSAVAHLNLYFKSVTNKRLWPEVQKSVARLANAKWKDFVAMPTKYNDSDMVWWRMWNYDPANDLKRVSCPGLCIFGAIDRLVPPETNESLMDSLLTVGGSQHRILVVPKLAHANATYQTLYGHKWEWPDAFWVWSYRPPEIDSALVDFVLGLSSTRIGSR